MKTTAYKVFTSDLRSPIRGGEPIWDGSLSHELPTVEVDKSDVECGTGWHACEYLADAVRIGGLWPNGRPGRFFRLEMSAPVIERGDKCRSSTWTILEEIEPRVAIKAFSLRYFKDLKDEIADEQLAWHAALGRPKRDNAVIEAGLELALQTRGLDWELRRFDSARDARDARAAWVARDARDARDAWVAWDAWDAWVAWAAWDARDAWAAWDTRDAWDAWATWDARDACDALIIFYTSKRGLIDQDSHFLTTGLRDAYRHGLGVAVPAAKNVLGWAMDES